MIFNRFSLLALIACMLTTFAHADQRPNIVLILADDVGFSDIGVFGSEIKTPNIDSLAQQGVQLTHYLAAPTCGPSRSMLLSGIDHHRVGAGVNAGTLLRLPHLKERPGYEGFLNDKFVSFATLLKDSGYHTFMTGKWDPGSIPGQLPVDHGFERSWVLAAGGASHFHDGVGTFRPVAEPDFYEDNNRIESLPEDFFSSEFYTSKMLEYVNDIDDDKPFVAYLSYTAAHWPLQVPDDWLDRYKGRYDDGWQALREARFTRQQALGVIPAHAQLPPQNRAVANWEDLTAHEKAVNARRMEIYASMIENMDFHIGRFLDSLPDDDDDRETIVIFLSDNGAEGNAIHRIIGNDEWIPERFDNSLDNMGRINSYVWLGVGWAQAAVTPFRKYKSYTMAGGIRTPAIFSSNRDRFRTGRSNEPITVRDITPTLLEIAGVDVPDGNYQGKPVLPISGKSALSFLEGRDPSVHGNEPLGWELYGSRALLKGEWKITRTYPPEGSGEWELFNLKTDPTETTDIGNDFAAVLDELIADWDDYAERNGVAVFDEDLGYGRYSGVDR